MTTALEPVLRFLHASAAGAPDAALLERFTRDADDTAFAALVERHGPMVLGACRRILGDAHAAEDAFQATFLVLARKAESLHRPELLPAWLHQVACRTARRARCDLTRRRQREQAAVRPAAADDPDDLLWADLRPLLDDAVASCPPATASPSSCATWRAKATPRPLSCSAVRAVPSPPGWPGPATACACCCPGAA